MRIRYLLLISISISLSLAEIKKICVCGAQQIPCPCPPDQSSRFNSIRDRVFRVFSVPSEPAPRPIPPQYFTFPRNTQPAPYAQNSIIDQPIGYVLTNSAAEAFYLNAATGQLVPTALPRPFTVQQVQPRFISPNVQPYQQSNAQLQQLQQFPQQPVPQQPQQFVPAPLSTAARPSLLISGGTPAENYRPARMIRHPGNLVYGANPGAPSFGIPTPANHFPVSGPFYPPQQLPQQPPQQLQPQQQFRTIPQQKQQSRPAISLSEPNLVPLSQLTRVIKKQRHVKQFNLEKPRPGDVEDFSFVDAGNEVVEESDFDRKYKSFVAGSPPSASIGEVVRTKPRSLLETLPHGLIAKVANKIALKVPTPKFSFSITPRKPTPNFQ